MLKSLCMQNRRSSKVLSNSWHQVWSAGSSHLHEILMQLFIIWCPLNQKTKFSPSPTLNVNVRNRELLARGMSAWSLAILGKCYQVLLLWGKAIIMHWAQALGSALWKFLRFVLCTIAKSEKLAKNKRIKEYSFGKSEKLS